MTELEALRKQVAHNYKIAVESQTLSEHFEKENERLRDALQKIEDWQRAYPLEVFPEPDFKMAANVLKNAGMTLDSISASNMRHVLNGIKKIVDAGLHNVELSGREEKL